MGSLDAVVHDVSGFRIERNGTLMSPVRKSNRRPLDAAQAGHLLLRQNEHPDLADGRSPMRG
jgi:hypothetical protein